MSFRERRNLVEHLRSLGFPRLVSLENFASPNFKLVSEVLAWLASCVGWSHTRLPSSIDTEQQRVTLVTEAATFFHQMLGVQLNTRKLYGADRLAARELLKITVVLYQAIQSLPISEADEEQLSCIQHITMQVSLKEMQEVRQLASSLTHKACNLSDGLQHEVENKVKRTSAVQQVVDLDSAEACMMSSLHTLAALVGQVEEEIEQLSRKQKELDEKILKKKESLTRILKRLEVLKKMKPAWQNEFQIEEEELRKVWQEYVTKHLYLSYLENQLQLSPPHTSSQEREADGSQLCGSGGGAVGKSDMFALGAAQLLFEEGTANENIYFDQVSSSEEDSTLSLS